MFKYFLSLILIYAAFGAAADQRLVFLEDAQGARIQIATLEIDGAGGYAVVMEDAAFTDHFLSMRPFKCLEGPAKNWCHLPYPYEIKRNMAADLTDLEYDFLFVWKDSGDYGINMWNGVYYKLEPMDGLVSGTLYEMDMNTIASPPAASELRPVQAKDLHLSDPDSHWLPRLVIE
jgi:hypothetical protein